MIPTPPRGSSDKLADANPPTDNSGSIKHLSSGTPSSNGSSSCSHPTYEPCARDDATAHGVASKTNPNCTIDENDIIIAVMGPTGAGKSTFVNTAVGRAEVEIGYDLKSRTRQVQPVRCALPNCRRNIVLVDTPGFDDTYMTDSEILKTIAQWLKVTYQNNIKLAGIIYLHRISDVRWSGTPLRNLAVFKDLCGEGNLKNIILVTTMWDELENRSVGYKREEELSSIHWRDMMRFGSQTCRFGGSHESAWDIINRLNLESSRETRAPLQIQKEMVDRNVPFNKTTAARTLFSFLKEEIKKLWGRLRKGFRGKPSGRKRPTLNFRLPRSPSRSSTVSSSFFEIASSISPNASSIFSTNSSQPSPADSTATGCSLDRRGTLAGLITALKLTYQVADMAGIPILRGSIGIVLQIAQLVEGMGGTHHAINQIIEQSGWLLEEIAQYAAESKLSKDMKRTLHIFQKELKNLQHAVKIISTRNPVSRFFLYDADVQALTVCTTAIKAIYDKLEVRLALDNRQAIAHLQDQLSMLCGNMRMRQCECGKFVVSEESRDSGQPS